MANAFTLAFFILEHIENIFKQNIHIFCFCLESLRKVDINEKYWHKLSFLQKNVLLTVLVILTLVGSMGALSFNMFQNSMMSLFERQSIETGEIVLKNWM